MHQVVEAWFGQTYGTPTDIQQRVWPVISQGRHVLFTAPTGSGKTLAAFLYSLDRLLTRQWESGRVTVLYVSPLKALNNDIQRNLTLPLGELTERFAGAGYDPPRIRARTRSGDTPNEERRQMLRHPPEILITTPESLNILLTSKSGRALLETVQKIILDEIHALAGTKRGTHLMTAVERVAELSEHEVQRIAISATVRPLDVVARFVAGYDGAGLERPINVVEGAADHRVALSVEYADPSEQLDKEDPSPWVPVIERLRSHIARNRSTLVFTTNRRDAEKVATLLNQAEGRVCAYPHHGSLSLELRREVESRMKEGSLEAIVATTSLELGIDIGSIDEVVLLRTPFTVASTVQMIGRAGHQVGAVSRGTFIPFFPRDLLNALVMVEAVTDRDIEEVHPPEGALDVLAQVIVSMTAHDEWLLDDLYAFFRRTYPYRALDRRLFEGVVDMLAGRYADTHIRELEPRLLKDDLGGTVRGKPGVERVLYHSGGTIPDRGYYDLRVAGGKSKLGELDEEFVWERRLGEVFVFGNQKWKIRQITDRDVHVEPAADSSKALPFWRGEPLHRDFRWTRRLLEVLKRIDGGLGASAGTEKDLIPLLRETLDVPTDTPEAAVRNLAELLQEQRNATGGLPHRHQIVIEDTAGRHDRQSGSHDVVIHTLWGGRVNYPLALLLQSALEDPEVAAFADDDAVLVQLPDHLDAEAVARALRDVAASPTRIQERLQDVLERSGFFAARFRENAGRALLLPRAGFDRRTPLWLNRLRARNILAVVSGFPDFPIVIETWRTCLQDAFDLPQLAELLAEVDEDRIRLHSAVTSNPSPFARDLVWQEANVRMYELDRGVGRSGVSSQTIRSALSDGMVERQIPVEILEETERRLKREEPHYAPETAPELVAWVRSRVVVPEDEWPALRDAAAPGADSTGADVAGADAGRHAALAAEPATRLCRLTLPGASGSFVTTIDRLPELERLLREEGAVVDLATAAAPLHLDWDISAEIHRAYSRRREPAEAGLHRTLYEFLGFYASLTQEKLRAVFGISESTAARFAEELGENGALFTGHDPRDEGAFCRSDVYEILLRRTRRRGRSAIQARPAELLPLFSATWHGLAPARDDEETERALVGAANQLSLLPLAPELLEQAFLPARIPGYRPHQLDDLMRRDEVGWVGAGPGRIALAPGEDLELARPLMESIPVGEEDFRSLFPAPRGRFTFWDVHDTADLGVEETEARLMEGVWHGRVSADTLQPLRSSAVSGKPTARDSGRRARRGGRGARHGRATPPAVSAFWYRLETPPPPPDEISALEEEKERARLLLDRHGIVFRERLRDEAPGFRWSNVANALRLMELSGEILGGYFVHGVPGIQFATPEAIELLTDLDRDSDSIFWLSASDPASVAGIGVEHLPYELPARQRSTVLVFRGTELVIAARRGGRDIDIHLGPDTFGEAAAELLSFATTAVSRAVEPLSRFVIEAVNGEAAAGTPYAAPLQELGFRTDHTRLVLWARYR